MSQVAGIQSSSLFARQDGLSLSSEVSDESHCFPAQTQASGEAERSS